MPLQPCWPFSVSVRTSFKYHPIRRERWVFLRSREGWRESGGFLFLSGPERVKRRPYTRTSSTHKRISGTLITSPLREAGCLSQTGQKVLINRLKCHSTLSHTTSSMHFTVWISWADTDVWWKFHEDRLAGNIIYWDKRRRAQRLFPPRCIFFRFLPENMPRR